MQRFSTAILLATTSALAVDPAGKLKVTVGGTYNTNATVESVAGSAIKAFLSILGVIFLLLLIYGGYTWMTAQGNEEGVATAKKIITAAVIGLVIIMASYAITDFVLFNLEGATLAQ